MASVQAEEILIFKHTEIPESVFSIPSSFNDYRSQNVLFKLHSTVFGHIFECISFLKLSDFDTQASVKQAKQFLSHELETGSSSSPPPLKGLTIFLFKHWKDTEDSSSVMSLTVLGRKHRALTVLQDLAG